MIKLEQNGVVIYIEGETIGGQNYIYRGESISVYIDASQGIDFAGFVCLNINNTNLSTYTCDSKGIVKFEMNYALRNITANSLITILLHDVNAWGIQFQVVVKDGVNIKSVVHPLPVEIMNTLGTTYSSEYRDLLLPPNVIYSLSQYPFSTPGNLYIPPIIFESNLHSWNRVYGLDDLYITPDSTYTDSHIISLLTTYIHTDDKYGGSYKIPIRELDDCENYVVIRWMSSFGNIRQHYFKIKDITNTLSSTNSLVVIGNGVQSVKNIDNEITVFVEGLTEYSLWYYSDLMLSSEIHSTIYKNECMYNPISGYIDTLKLDYTLSEITTKEITYNPSTKFYNLELTLNKKQFRRY